MEIQFKMANKRTKKELEDMVYTRDILIDKQMNQIEELQFNNKGWEFLTKKVIDDFRAYVNKMMIVVSMSAIAGALWGLLSWWVF